MEGSINLDKPCRAMDKELRGVGGVCACVCVCVCVCERDTFWNKTTTTVPIYNYRGTHIMGVMQSTGIIGITMVWYILCSVCFVYDLSTIPKHLLMSMKDKSDVLVTPQLPSL